MVIVEEAHSSLSQLLDWTWEEEEAFIEIQRQLNEQLAEENKENE